jgi:hypothetical protein
MTPFRALGTLSERDGETAAFTVFLYGRRIGCAAEIDDHLNRGRHMDTRTPLAECRFVTLRAERWCTAPPLDPMFAL